MAMSSEKPNVIVLAGPNGAGKSTLSHRLLSDTLRVPHFVNADVIARGLSAFRSEEMAIKAGRIMLEQLHSLAAEREDFAFETTLASKTFAPWIANLKATGYVCHLFFFFVPSPDVSIERVRERVRRGGHSIPEDTIRRRYQKGLENLFTLYLPIADHWQVYDNSGPDEPRLIARGNDKIEFIENKTLWDSLRLRVQK